MNKAAASAQTCTIPAEVVAAFKKFKVAKNPANCAFIMKINKNSMAVEIDREVKDVTLEQLASDMPETAPRYVAYSYKHTHKDERVSYPLIFLYFVPPGINPSISMMYASTKQRLVQELGIGKDFEVRNVSECTEAWLKQKLGLFE